MVACLTAHPTTITEFSGFYIYITTSKVVLDYPLNCPTSTTTSAPLPKGGPTISSTQSPSIPRSDTSIILWSSSPSGTTTASNSSQPIHSEPTHFPWPALAGPVGFLIVFTAAFWFYLRRGENLRHRRMLPDAPTNTSTAEPPSTLTVSMNGMGSGAEPLVTPQSPVTETIASPGADAVSINATFGSTGSISMRSTTGASTTESKETSGDAMGRGSQAMAEWASLGQMPQLVLAGNEPRRGTMPAEESAQGQRYTFPSTESICTENSALEAQNNFLAQSPGVAEVDDRSGQQDRHSTMAQRNTSVSGESVTTIMTDPPPPYSAGPDPGESFNPANFDLSLVTTRPLLLSGIILLQAEAYKCSIYHPNCQLHAKHKLDHALGLTVGQPIIMEDLRDSASKGVAQMLGAALQTFGWLTKHSERILAESLVIWRDTVPSVSGDSYCFLRAFTTIRPFYTFSSSSMSSSSGDSFLLPELPEPDNHAGTDLSKVVIGLIIAGSIGGFLFILSGLAYALWRKRRRTRRLRSAAYSTVLTSQLLDRHTVGGELEVITAAGGKGRMREEQGNGVILEWTAFRPEPNARYEYVEPVRAGAYAEEHSDPPMRNPSVTVHPTVRPNSLQVAEEREEPSAPVWDERRVPVGQGARAASDSFTTVGQSLRDSTVPVPEAPPPYSIQESFA
ncbi:hypothetical protein BC629DRAFT_1446974 [Irpex lacteus]|nr:hypothetical protein BC629DRAFT_1446974 [Irpex lacteus]